MFRGNLMLGIRGHNWEIATEFREIALLRASQRLAIKFPKLSAMTLLNQLSS
jgi:hypothetical protein